MIRAFRITTTSRLASAFEGKGSKLAGGRWNHKGLAVVYCSESRSLATLEILVHLEDDAGLSALYSVVPIEIPEDCVEALSVGDLEDGWDADVAYDASRSVGSLWVKEARSAVLKVPSAITKTEWNYLLNPEHPDFKKLKIGKPESFALDPRLKKK